MAVFGTPQAVRHDNGTEFRGAFAAYCTAVGIWQQRTSPYTSHANGQAERLHRTVEDLLRRCLVTLEGKHLPRLVADIQLAVNTTYARSIGCPPFLVMFGTTPPDAPALQTLPDPTTATGAKYTAAVQHCLRVVQRAAQAAHSHYAARAAVELPPDTVTQQL